MKASLTTWVAAGVILTAGAAAFGASGAAAGLRAPVPAHLPVAAPRVGERRAIERGGSRLERDRLSQLGAADATEAETPAWAQEQEAPQAAAFCPPAAEFGRAPTSSGPRIIEIGARARRRGPWPLVVYGD